MKSSIAIASAATILCSCASHTGVVAMGGNKFMIAKQQATGFPGLGNMKAEIIAEASRHCAGVNRELQVLSANETKPPYILGNYPRTEIEFTCVTSAQGTAKP